MLKLNLLLTFAILFSLSFLASCTKSQKPTTIAETFDLFKNPPSEFRTAPLWVWNDKITKEEISEQLRDFKAHGLGGVFVHPRPGLITPYLSDEWLFLFRYTVQVGKELGMKIWIYDENSYPSGFAGGHVPDEMPDAVGKGLRMNHVSELPQKFENSPLLVLKRQNDQFIDVTNKTSNEKGDYYIFDLKKNKPSPWFGGFAYVDIMRSDVTKKFLHITLDAYKKAFGDEFGKTVPGVFEDEAHISPVGGRDVVNYTPELFAKFREKWGYDLRTHLPSLYEEVGNWKKVRFDYYATLLDLFVHGWSIPYSDYCAKNKLISTGHYWEHAWPRPRMGPDNMMMYSFEHMPGIDCLMNNWQTDVHAQFGNDRAVKEIRSIANQMGRKRTLCETYGAGGWDLTFRDQKRIGDWLFSLGMNFMNQHLSYMTIKGARKRDHPQSFSYHEPWWHDYKMLADYFGRLSVVLSSGDQQNNILVLEPTTSAWMYYSPEKSPKRLDEIGEGFQTFVHQLEKNQVEYDLGSENVIKEHGWTKGSSFGVGEKLYNLVILPPFFENINRETLDLLKKYLQDGGKILSYDKAPRFVNGVSSIEADSLRRTFPKNWIHPQPEMIFDRIAGLSPAPITFSRDTTGSQLLFHHRRVYKDGEILFLVNTSVKTNVTGYFNMNGSSVEKWDPFTGKKSSYPFLKKGSTVQVEYNLPPVGSLILCVREGKSAEQAGKKQNTLWRTIPAEDAVRITRESPNVLTLDYCDLLLGGKSFHNLYFYEAQLKTYQHHGLPRNPWDSAVQFKTNIIDKNHFPQNSGFEATFWFPVSQGVDTGSLRVVVERPERFQVSINGKAVAALPGKWWLDKAFGVYDIGSFVHPGRNSITVKASPFSIYSELESVYLLGNFNVKTETKGFSLIPARALQLGVWNEQGMPFYAHGVSYQKTFRIESNNAQNRQYIVALPSWLGSVADVFVDDVRAGSIAFPPYQLDITDKLPAGEHKIKVIVYGTLKNLLGPHHGNPPLGRAWPGSFQKGAPGGRPSGSEYSTVGYGLFEDFQLRVSE
ncbi:MAG: hypothetical protein GWP06_14475 [Actinobacteria bacterium]|nr:hypothetical protein [Actinomycetota bacterium]